MLQFLKFSKLSGALKSQGPPQAAYAAVLELGRIGTPKAVDLLIESLSRRDGVSRGMSALVGCTSIMLGIVWGYSVLGKMF